MIFDLGELQAMNAFAVDLIASEEDYEQAAVVLTHTISALSTAVKELVEPVSALTTPSRSNCLLPQGSHRLSCQMDLLLLDNAATMSETESSSSNASSFSKTKTSSDEHQECLCFVRRPCMFECPVYPEYPKTFDLPTGSTSQRAAAQIPQCCHSAPGISPEQHCAVAVSCLYNLALCYHLQWYKQKQERYKRPAPSDGSLIHLDQNITRHLVRALELYELAFRAGFGAGASSSSSRMLFEASDPIWPIIMAICANAAHCAMELAQLPTVHVWNTRLCSSLHYTEETVPHHASRYDTSVARDANMDENDDESLQQTWYDYERVAAQEYRAFLWNCALRHREYGTGAAMA